MGHALLAGGMLRALPYEDRATLRLVCKFMRDAVDDATTGLAKRCHHLRPRSLPPASRLHRCRRLQRMGVNICCSHATADETATSIAELASAISGTLAPTLRCLHVGSCHRQEAAGKLSPLWPALPNATALQRLTISRIEIGKDSERELARFLAGSPKLRELRLENTEAAMATLAPTLPALGATLSRLYLNNNSFGDQGALVLAPALLQLAGLIELDLSANDLGARAAAALAPAFAQLACLVVLNLSNNELNLEGVAALAPSLLPMHKLQRLNLSGNGIGERGAAVLNAALMTLTNHELRRVDMSRNLPDAKPSLGELRRTIFVLT